jgi:hypothetical protein
MQGREGPEGSSTECREQRTPWIVGNLWLKQSPARGGGVSVGSQGEQLLEEDLALVSCLSLEPGGQLTRSEAGGPTEEVRRIRFETPETCECLHPRAGDFDLTRGEHRAVRPMERVEPATPEGRRGAGRAGEHGERGDALLATTLMPLQLMEGEGVAPDVRSGEGHEPKRP